MTPFTRTYTASPADIDELGHVNNAVWVQWIQDMATAHWRAVAAPASIAAYVWVVIRHEIDYRGNIALGESVTARTWVPNPPRGARFDRHVTFTGADGKIKVSAITVWAMLDKTSGRVQRVPADLAARFLSGDTELAREE